MAPEVSNDSGAQGRFCKCYSVPAVLSVIRCWPDMATTRAMFALSRGAQDLMTVATSETLIADLVCSKFARAFVPVS